MQREQIIEALVVDCLVSIFDRNQYCWLQGILENGFRGFAQMSTEDLLREMQHRQLTLSSEQDELDDLDVEDGIAGHQEIFSLGVQLSCEEV